MEKKLWQIEKEKKDNEEQREWKKKTWWKRNR